MPYSAVLALEWKLRPQWGMQSPYSMSPNRLLALVVVPGARHNKTNSGWLRRDAHSVHRAAELTLSRSLEVTSAGAAPHKTLNEPPGNLRKNLVRRRKAR